MVQLISNDRIISAYSNPRIESITSRFRLSWLGHVIWMTDEKFPKKALIYEPIERRTRGRPQTSGTDCIINDYQKLLYRNALPHSYYDHR